MCILVRSVGTGVSSAICIQDKSKSGSAKGQLKGSTQIKSDLKLVRCIHLNEE